VSTKHTADGSGLRKSHKELSDSTSASKTNTLDVWQAKGKREPLDMRRDSIEKESRE
jgi:hypothetical protein